MGIIVYFWDSKSNCISHFVLSEQSVPKNAELSVQEITRVLKKRFGGKDIDTLLVWSDGSTKEFLNATMGGNMGKFAKELGIKIVWIFFANNHGKNLCYQNLPV